MCCFWISKSERNLKNDVVLFEKDEAKNLLQLFHFVQTPPHPLSFRHPRRISRSLGKIINSLCQKLTEYLYVHLQWEQLRTETHYSAAERKAYIFYTAQMYVDC
jgi:hypothetical protein